MDAIPKKFQGYQKRKKKKWPTEYAGVCLCQLKLIFTCIENWKLWKWMKIDWTNNYCEVDSGQFDMDGGQLDHLSSA